MLRIKLYIYINIKKELKVFLSFVNSQYISNNTLLLNFKNST